MTTSTNHFSNEEIQRIRGQATRKDRVKAAQEIQLLEKEIEKTLSPFSKLHIQGQSIHAPFFTDLVSSTIGALLEKKSPLIEGYGEASILGTILTAGVDLVSAQGHPHLSDKELLLMCDRTSSLLQGVSPLLNGMSHVVCPTGNFAEAAISMKMPTVKTCEHIFKDEKHGHYLITLPSLRGMTHPPNHMSKVDYDKAVGILIVNFYAKDSEATLEDTGLIERIPLDLMDVVVSKEASKNEIVNFVQNICSHNQLWNTRDDLPKGSQVFDFTFTICDGVNREVYEPLVSMSIDDIVNKRFSNPRANSIGELALKLVLMSMTNGSTYSNAKVITNNGSGNNPTIQQVRGQGKKKTRRQLSVQPLRLNPDISVIDERKREIEREFGGGAVSPHWRAFHFHSFWKGSGENRHLGLPQPVSGFMVTGDKAKQKRERLARRAEHQPTSNHSHE